MSGISLGKFFSTSGLGRLPKGNLQLYADNAGRTRLRLLDGKNVIGDVFAASKDEKSLMTAVKQGVKNLEDAGFTHKPMSGQIAFPDGFKPISISSKGCKLMGKTVTPEVLKKELENARKNALEYMSFNSPATTTWGQFVKKIDAALNRLSIIGK